MKHTQQKCPIPKNSGMKKSAGYQLITKMKRGERKTYSVDREGSNYIRRRKESGERGHTGRPLDA